MELVRVDTRRAYERIRERIATLDLAPGSPINDQQLAKELEMGLASVQEALKLLVHDGLVELPPRRGFYVSEVSLPDLQQISEMRLSLETLSARLAAQRATADDLVVLEALRLERAAVQSPATIEERRRLFDLDHKFHRAVAQAAHNKYLAETLERFFGLSQRLWYLVLPELEFLPAAVEEHLDLVEAIRAGDAEGAAAAMHDHVYDFYDKVRKVLAEGRPA